MVLSDSPDRNRNAYNVGEDFYQFGVNGLDEANGRGNGLLYRNNLSADVKVRNQKITYGNKLKKNKFEVTNFVIGDVENKTSRRVSDERIGLNQKLLLDVSGEGIETSTSGNYVAGKHKNALGVSNQSNMKINSLEKGTLKVKKRALSFKAFAQDKEYDGNTSATVNVTDDNRVRGDIFDILASKANFEDANIGDDKFVTALFELLGDDADNYELFDRSELFASITEATKKTTTVQTQVQASPDGNLQGMFNINMSGMGNNSGSASGNGGVDKDAAMGSEL